MGDRYIKRCNVMSPDRDKVNQSHCRRGTAQGLREESWHEGTSEFILCHIVCLGAKFKKKKRAGVGGVLGSFSHVGEIRKDLNLNEREF